MDARCQLPEDEIDSYVARGGNVPESVKNREKARANGQQKRPAPQVITITGAGGGIPAKRQAVVGRLGGDSAAEPIEID